MARRAASPHSAVSRTYSSRWEVCATTGARPDRSAPSDLMPGEWFPFAAIQDGPRAGEILWRRPLSAVRAPKAPEVPEDLDDEESGPRDGSDL